MTDVDFTELARERRALSDAVRLHQQSVRRFWVDKHNFFALDQAEVLSPKPRSDGRPGHLSTSLSCFESLADIEPARGDLSRFSAVDPKEDQHRWPERLERFTAAALSAPRGSWKSEGAADVYCRVRTLPGVLRLARREFGPLALQATELLIEAWTSVDPTRPTTAGLAERELYKAQRDESGTVVDYLAVARDDRHGEGYPPNAFHTYWGWCALDEYFRRAKRDGTLPGLGAQEAEVLANAELARAWARQTLGRQTALILNRAERCDPQQLAYALATDVRWAMPRPASGPRRWSLTPRWAPAELTAGDERFELYRAALEAFFSTQLKSGVWPQSEPLFHYPESGNAYCFTYETLTELLRPALPREHGRVYRTLLAPHLGKLLEAWRHAESTRVPLLPGDTEPGGDAYGWSSGHHTFRPQPEGWATAGVYSFLQMLRCVVGHFTAEAASRNVRIRRPKHADPEDARTELSRRGSTWPRGKWTVGRQLASMFLHPREATQADPDIRDPDTPLIGEDEARSAILFGPPGTGKTTLAEALAGALGWRFVEVQAAEFLSRGVDAVPARADEIFSALMELDRCVVLFDEIDELIRGRTEQETDPFGRFLTTSMLPKIAQLWEQRRIVFFVATNHVAKADPAIRRSSRFDAAILVAPPSLEVKRQYLEEELLRYGGRLRVLPADLNNIRAIEDALHKANEVEQWDLPLGVLALLRWDQVSELALTLSSATEDQAPQRLRAALTRLGAQLYANEWRPSDPDQDDMPATDAARLPPLFKAYRDYRNEEREDRSRRHFAVVKQVVRADLPEGWQEQQQLNDDRTLCALSFDLPENIVMLADGRLCLETDAGAVIVDDGLLEFGPEPGRSPSEAPAPAEQQSTSEPSESAGLDNSADPQSPES